MAKKKSSGVGGLVLFLAAVWAIWSLVLNNPKAWEWIPW